MTPPWNKLTKPVEQEQENGLQFYLNLLEISTNIEANKK
jgi:hypothetical protein